MPVPAQKEPMLRTTAKERVYRTLRQWIIDGTLEPDERLNDEELARYFAVSRTPVREALQLLREQKLVTIIPASGTFVAPIDIQDMHYAYELLTCLHSFALELCIHRIARADVSRLRALNDHMLECIERGDVQATREADFEFHRALCQLTENPYLVGYSDQLMLQMMRNENHFFKECTDAHASYKSHGRILDALQAGDLAAAQRELKANWALSAPKDIEDAARSEGPSA